MGERNKPDGQGSQVGWSMYRYFNSETGEPATWEEIEVSGLGIDKASPGLVNDDLPDGTYWMLPAISH